VRARPEPDTLYISNPDFDQHGVVGLMVGRVVFDADARFAGLVFARLDPEFFTGVMRSVLYAPDMVSGLATRDGQLFMHETLNSRPVNTRLTVAHALLVHHVQSGRSGNFYSDQGSVAGEPSLLALRTIRPKRVALSTPLFVQVSRDASAVFHPWSLRLWMTLGAYGLVLLIAVLALQLHQRQRQVRERIEAEQDKERRDNAQRLALALAGAELGLWDRNFSNNIRTYNERWSTMLGYEPGEIEPTGAKWQELLHPEDLAEATEALGRHIQGQTPFFESQHRLRHKQGNWIWILARGRVVERDAQGLPLRMVGTHMDISAQKRVEQVLRESEARFRSLTELSSDWYWEMDEQFRFTRIDGNRESSAGLDRHQDIGCTVWDRPAYNMGEAQWDAHRATLRSHKVFRDLELERHASDGQAVWISVSGIPVYDERGKFQGYRGVGRNITARRIAEHKIEQLAFYDELTGLPNRRLLSDRLHAALATVARNHRHGALIFIDLDNFKDLNDTQGHDMGDLLLQQVAQRLRDCVREIDTVARLGGDEFVVMLEELNPYAGEAALQADGTGRKILGSLNQPYELRGLHHHSTPSIGIALFHDRMQSVDELLKRADLAMYQAKAAGRNALRFYDPGMQAVATARATLEAELRLGLERKELRLFYQPVVDEARSMGGVEALVRWQHPQRGVLGPVEFIDMAEQSGLIIPLGQWVLQAACDQLVSWSTSFATRDLCIAVNVSASQFRQSDFSSQVLDLLSMTGANPYRLKLELTESLLLVDMDDAIEKMTELRSIGVSFALDDFGTGYSSLSYLKLLPLDQLKIDQSFVRDVLANHNDAAIVRTILALAKSMDLIAVAEGVETEAQMQFLLDHGCEAFQGYLFGGAMSVPELESLAENFLT
jgi:diguanylate cyclase (GGDEF)-like protein/PAS domain S-box-containing protein